MNYTFTIELCPEDRARLDRLAEALERKACDKCVATAMECMKTCQQPKAEESDPLDKAIAETLAKAGAAVEPQKSPAEAVEETTLTTTPPEEEKPTEETPTAEPTAPTVTHADVKALYIKLAASGKRESAKAVIMPVSTTISGIPQDKIQEVYKQLVALEG